MREPRRAKASAKRFPNPLPAPVTSMVFPLNSLFEIVTLFRILAATWAPQLRPQHKTGSREFDIRITSSDTLQGCELRFHCHFCAILPLDGFAGPTNLLAGG